MAWLIIALILQTFVIGGLIYLIYWLVNKFTEEQAYLIDRVQTGSAVEAAQLHELRTKEPEPAKEDKTFNLAQAGL